MDGNDDINSTISPIRVDPPPHTPGSDVILHLVKTIKLDVELAQVRTGFKKEISQYFHIRNTNVEAIPQPS